MYGPVFPAGSETSSDALPAARPARHPSTGTVPGFLLLWGVMCSCDAADVSPTTTVAAADPGVALGSMSTHMDNSTMQPPHQHSMLMCSSFHCFGPQCYQNESLYMHPTMDPTMNATMMNSTMNSTMDPTHNPHMNSSEVPPMKHGVFTMQCANESFCELIRHNATHYSAGCASHCTLGHHACVVNGTMRDACTMDCCDSSLCLMKNSTVYGDLLPTKPPATTTTVTTTKATTTAFPGNKKWCRTFSCSGVDCFKGKESKHECRVGHDYCELKKKFSGTAVSYTAGCSNSCAKAGIKSCSGATTGECYQECCNATTTACCMKLDGSVHLNGASQLHRGSLFQLLLLAVIVILSSRLPVLAF